MAWDIRSQIIYVSPPEFPKVEHLTITDDAISLRTDDGQFRIYHLNKYQAKDGHWYNADGSRFKLGSQITQLQSNSSAETQANNKYI